MIKKLTNVQTLSGRDKDKYPELIKSVSNEGELFISCKDEIGKAFREKCRCAGLPPTIDSDTWSLKADQCLQQGELHRTPLLANIGLLKSIDQHGYHSIETY